MAEIRPVIGYEDHYEVDSTGVVYGKPLKHKCFAGRFYTQERRVLGGKIDNSGYRRVWLGGKYGGLGVRKLVTVHKIVCTAFHGMRPSDKHQVNHKDGNKLNNAADNLEWVTGTENIRHSVRIGLRKYETGPGHHSSVLTQEQHDEIRSSPLSGYALAKKMGVHRSTIQKLRKRFEKAA